MFVAAVLVGCVSCKKNQQTTPVQPEDLRAKKLLQGVWVSADDDSPVLMAKGDTIFYPDSTSMPVAVKIVADTL